MMDNDQIVECVPNFSEGRDKKVIDAIADAIRKHPNLALIDIDPGYSTNRTVYTIVGRPSNVIDSILSAAQVANRLIDMRKHTGEHKRIGALDVCPFVPIHNVTMDDCVEYAKTTAENLSNLLRVPTYLYGYAATAEHRKTVPSIRQGEYEGLRAKLQDPNWKPDYGTDQFTNEVERWGATLCGARKVLIAYNINLMGTKEQANKIAFDIREQGRSGSTGVFKTLQAMGWSLNERKISQITMNLMDLDVTSLVQVWDEVNKRAKLYNLALCGSEIVGVVPLRALLDVADHYIEQENLLLLEEDLKIQYVISRLGLSFLNEFKPREKIIEYILEDQNKHEKLIDLSIKSFITEVRNREVVPGGGSVSALIASLAASLATMVGRISTGRKKFENNENLMKILLPVFYEASDRLLNYVDKDSQAYSKIVEANRLPEVSDDDKMRKMINYRSAILNAIEVPRLVIDEVINLMEALEKLCPIININAISDLQVAICCFRTAVHGAYYNVMINLKNLIWDFELRTTIENDIIKKKHFIDQTEQRLLSCLNELMMIENAIQK